MKDLRVGYAPADFTDWAEPATRPAFDAAIAVLKASGVQLVETKLPDFPYGAALSTILNGEMGSIFEPLITSGKVDELADKPQIAGLKASLELPAKDYLKAMRLRRLIQDEVRNIFGSVRRPACSRPRRHRPQGRSAPRPRTRPVPHLRIRVSAPSFRWAISPDSPPSCFPAASPKTCPSPSSWSASRSPKTHCSPSAANSSPTPTGTSAARPPRDAPIVLIGNCHWYD